MARNQVTLTFVGDDRSLSKTLRNVDSSSTKTGSALGKLGMIAKGGAAAGLIALGVAAKIGWDEMMQGQKVAAQTAAVLKSTGGAANVTAKQIDALGTSLMKKSGTDDEAIKSGANLLLTFTNVRNEVGKGNDIFNQATVAALDLSVAFGKDMTSSSILVGKALNDPIKGISALSKVGVTFTQGQKDTIKAMVKLGDTAGAQKVILAELTKETGGSAAAFGKTLPGRIAIAKESFANLTGELMTKLLPAIEKILSAALKVLDAFANIGRTSEFGPGKKSLLGPNVKGAGAGRGALPPGLTRAGSGQVVPSKPPPRVTTLPPAFQRVKAMMKSHEAEALGRQTADAIGRGISSGTLKGFWVGSDAMEAKVKARFAKTAVAVELQAEDAGKSVSAALARGMEKAAGINAAAIVRSLQPLQDAIAGFDADMNARSLKRTMEDMTDASLAARNALFEVQSGLGLFNTTAAFAGDTSAFLAEDLKALRSAERTFTRAEEDRTSVPANQTREAWVRQLAGIPQMAAGGIVPGSRGSPVPILAHGGELVTPPGGGGGNTYITIHTGADPASVVKAIDQYEKRNGRRFVRA